MAPEFAVYTAYLGADSKYELTDCCPELFNWVGVFLESAVVLLLFTNPLKG